MPILEGIRDDGDVEEESCVEEVDFFIEKLGLTISDRDGKEVKLSKFLKLSRDDGKAHKTNRGMKELKKLAYDMKDGKLGEGDFPKGSSRMGIDKVTLC